MKLVHKALSFYNSFMGYETSTEGSKKRFSSRVNLQRVRNTIDLKNSKIPSDLCFKNSIQCKHLKYIKRRANDLKFKVYLF